MKTILKIFCMFAFDLHTQRRDVARQIFIAGFFYAQILMICGSVPPCVSIMDALPLWCKSTGKAEPFFIPAYNLNNSVMTYTENECTTSAQETIDFVNEIKESHSDNRQFLTNRLLNSPISQLVKDFMVEMDAKNTAYYFIIENGHFDDFVEYCEKERRMS